IRGPRADATCCAQLILREILLEMIRYISLRLLFALPALWLIVTMVFLLAHIVPGDPVAQMLGEGARADDLQQLRHALGLDVPIPLQYERYLKGILRGNLGESFRFQQPVTKVILEHYPATLELAAVALGVCILIGIPAGVLAAHRRGERTDHAVGVLTLFGLSLPNFALGPVLMLVFSVMLGWLPVTGRGGIPHLILPAFTLGAALAAILTRMVRTSVIEELSADYVRTARAKGVSESGVLFRHALRNALIPILTILGLQFGALLAGTIVTETIFSWPGIGRVTVQAINARDYPLLQGCILLIAVTYVIVNLLTDVVYAIVDPRVRFE
ncbi:MAG: nickel ABC transporter permease, partial [Candidatus Acidiferrales bacterium]